MDSIDPNIVDKSMRSVFVGNVPYDVSEDKLKEIFSEIGNVVSFKLVYDRETGKPKGYGFCEYRDAQTACSAMRNLNGYEVNGRAIRVDNACTEKSRMEMQSLMQSQNFESPYGPPCDPESTPEIISQMIASMSPEALFDLVKQIKRSFQNNPDETKTMLTSNPQLSYAILQALVVLKLIDVESACAMLYKKNSIPPLLQPMDPIQQMARHIIGAPPAASLPLLQQSNTSLPQMHSLQHPINTNKLDFPFPSIDNRGQRAIDQDFRNISGPVPVPAPVSAPSQMSVPVPVPVPPLPQSAMTTNSITNAGIPTTSTSVNLQNDMMLGRDAKKLDPRTRPSTTASAAAVAAAAAAAAATATAATNMPTINTTATQPQRPVIKQEPKTSSSSSSSQNDAFLKMANLQNAPSSAALGAALGMTTGSGVGSAGAGAAAATGAPSTDHEKATLIMQVLQLSDEQIALLPADQRKSIMSLREQIAKSTNLNN